MVGRGEEVVGRRDGVVDCGAEVVDRRDGVVDRGAKVVDCGDEVVGPGAGVVDHRGDGPVRNVAWGLGGPGPGPSPTGPRGPRTSCPAEAPYCLMPRMCTEVKVGDYASSRHPSQIQDNLIFPFRQGFPAAGVVLCLVRYDVELEDVKRLGVVAQEFGLWAVLLKTLRILGNISDRWSQSTPLCSCHSASFPFQWSFAVDGYSGMAFSLFWSPMPKDAV